MLLPITRLIGYGISMWAPRGIYLIRKQGHLNLEIRETVITDTRFFKELAKINLDSGYTKQAAATLLYLTRCNDIYIWYKASTWAAWPFILLKEQKSVQDGRGQDKWTSTENPLKSTVTCWMCSLFNFHVRLFMFRGTVMKLVSHLRSFYSRNAGSECFMWWLVGSG